MRLLKRIQEDDFCLTEDLDETAVPPYAILSHTWEAEAEEVTFEDIQRGGGTTKLGYKKIRYCGKQAEQDELQYFWIDTCCIDKANKAEFSHAINSMYRWYHNAKRCYVYLVDVLDPAEEFSPPLREGLRKSRWFTRGWTLQELLAPETVDFFAHNWRRIGDKVSLRQQIHEITGISHFVLHGALLAQLDIEERFSWNVHRHTTLEEDRIYSLLGIFDVYLSPFYGEGASKARDRLMDQIKQRERCIQDLRPGDPRDDKKRIEDTKGGLLHDAYCWVLDNASFQQWHSDPNSQLLWIKGDPGKGKTMLLCGIIDELQKTADKSTTIAYFFCQATDSRINTAVAVLRGLLYMIANQRPLLVSHIRKKYDQAGKSLFEDANAWTALTEIFADILRDRSLGTTYLLVDALDECVADLSKLLDFVAKHSSVSSRVKWIVSSRNWPDIEERLERVDHKVRLSLELNAKPVSTAVATFIQKKVSDLAQRKKYDEWTRNAVLQHLLSNANDTFLWVAVVCQSLESTAKRNVQKKLGSFAPGLNSLYERMMQQIGGLDDAELCKQVLASVALVYRPVTLQELTAIVEQLEEQADDLESLQEVVGLCASFLTLRQDTVYFIHQSAQDFLLDKAVVEIFPSGREDVHHKLFSRSLQVLSATLHRDMYDLEEPGYSLNDLEQLESDPLKASRYSCIYWVDHLLDAHTSCLSRYVEDLQDGGVVDTFLQKKYLYWLEGLSLCKSVSHGVVLITRLQSLVKKQKQAAQLNELVYDALRFAMYHKVAIECSPLQTYTSALLFSPKNSWTRRLFEHEAPKGIVVKPDMQESWSACLQTLEGHSSSVTSVAFSSDSRRLASASYDLTIKIWDASSGECLQMLKQHSSSVNSVAFSSDSTRLASASDDTTAKIWDVSSRECLQTLEEHSAPITSVAFSSDSTRLASASYDMTIKIWDASSGECLQTLKGHSGPITSVAFSSDSTRLASASYDMTIKIWDASTGECLQTLKGHSDWVTSVAFLRDSTRLASASYDMTIKIWDTGSGECLQTLKGHSGSVDSVAFSSDSTRLASASDDMTVKIWDASSGECLQTLRGHGGSVDSVAFSSDSTRLASASDDTTAKIWDVSSRECLQTLEEHSASVTSVAFSSDSTRLASASNDTTVKVWDASSGECLQTLEGHSGSVNSVAFLRDSTRLVSASYDTTVKIWDVSSGECLQTLKGHSNSAGPVAFSSDWTRLASASYDTTVKIWDASSGKCLQTLEGHSNFVVSVAFSSDSTRLASASYDMTLKIWDASSGECLQTLKGHSDWVTSVAFSSDSTRLASASDDRTVKIWDASSGECLQTLKNHSDSVASVAFDFTGYHFDTNAGVLALDECTNLDSMNVVQPKRPQSIDISMSTDRTWIAFNGRRVLWIPSEYRGACSSTRANTIGIGTGSGRVWICTIDGKRICQGKSYR